MPDQAVREHVRPVVARFPTSRVPDNQLAAMRLAPRRPPELVARRAATLGLKPHRAPGRGYRTWPLLIIAGVALAYLVVGLAVIR